MRPSSDSAIKASARASQYRLLGLAALVLLSLIALLENLSGNGQSKSSLLLIGVLLGITLFHGSVSFTAAYRNLIVYRDSRGIQVQLLMIALASVLFAPALSQGQLFGQSVYGALAPVGIQVAVGAFIFGIGMQLAGGCGSGTLYTAGSGNLKMVLVMVMSCAGSFWATLDMQWWLQLPSTAAVSLGSKLGWIWATVLQLSVLASIAWGLRVYSRRFKQTPSTNRVKPSSIVRRLLSGPWPLLAAGVVLAILNFATLAEAGHPWTITWAFSLWGAKAATLTGWAPEAGSFWTAPFQSRALESSILADTTSLMNIGLLLGAFIAASAAGRAGTKPPSTIKPYLAAIIGGLMLGYGARIAFGCNIGALFSGIASTSLHGWLWILAALPGNWVGVKLRPGFGLRN
ncbi:MAG: YeeE/YedE family protein [Motiliproteus sp.]|nr:YeeE/YedE family protein [Motiliproteus sp.]MCW9054103.1 YeeE/YedE family protein [Motiliproteus sp.]